MKGANSYFVVVAKDANFSNVIDEGFTWIPAYAPRNQTTPTTYSDETTTFYWAVLPATLADGTDALPLDLPNSAKGSFQKQSAPPSPLAPAAGHVFVDQPTSAGRRRWERAATGCRSRPTRPSAIRSTTCSRRDLVLERHDLPGRHRPLLARPCRRREPDRPDLPTGTFRKTLQAPFGSAGNATKGDAIPTWSWNVVPGAVAYDLSVDLPDGTHKVLSGYRTPAMTPVLMYGTGIFQWRVRAEYPADTGSRPAALLDDVLLHAHDPRAEQRARGLQPRPRLLSWDAKPGARGYRVQLSGTPEFSRLVENITTDNTSYAPLLKYFGQFSLNTGKLYWRVAAMDEGNNVGDYTAPQLISRVRRMEVGVMGALKRGSRRWLTVNVKDFETSSGVGGSLLRLRGAGVLRKARTAAYGSVRLRLRPTRRGYLVISASRRGYAAASITLRIAEDDDHRGAAAGRHDARRSRRLAP
jgi:hypothetical protein